jgi:hypothetical protein
LRALRDASAELIYPQKLEEVEKDDKRRNQCHPCDTGKMI